MSLLLAQAPTDDAAEQTLLWSRSLISVNDPEDRELLNHP